MPTPDSTREGRVDFGSLGAARAYPGALASSWGAMLVEPPAVAAIRAHASSKIARLGSFAPARSGIATRVVAYFIVEDIHDPAKLAEHGIRSRSDLERLAVVQDGRGVRHLIERAALKPMVRRPGALEGRIDVPESLSEPWKVLYLSDTADGLREKRWAHTLAYIRYGETTDFPAREGSRRRGGIPALRPQVSVRPVWFQVPRMETGPGRVCWIKGRGSKHYAPVLADDVLVPDNFLYSSPPPGLANPRAFAAVANLSFTNLMVEVHGRRSGGDGVLHTYKRELDMLPMLDPRLLTRDQADELVGLFETVAARPVTSVDEDLRDPDRQALDLWAMRYLVGPDTAVDAARTVERALRDLAAERTDRLASGREQERVATRRRGFDPEPVATRIIADHGNPPNVLVQLAGYEPETPGAFTADVPSHQGVETLFVGESLFDASHVVLNGSITIETPSNEHAGLLMAALRADGELTGRVALPSDAQEAGRILTGVNRDWDEWCRSVTDAVATALPGPQRAIRRQQVGREVERQTGTSPGSVVAF